MTAKRTATLRERLTIAVIENMARDVEEKRTMFVVQKACETLLDEIAARCAARGYTELVGWERGYMETMTIEDFLAELRGELAS